MTTAARKSLLRGDKNGNKANRLNQDDEQSTTRMAKLVFDSLTNDPRWDTWFLVALLSMELAVCILILHFVSYTEIDWEAYMQEVSTWQEGEKDYLKIRGATGPLVYPAGFLYLYGVLKKVSDNGTQIYNAQVCFVGFYLVSTGLVLCLYNLVLQRARQANSATALWVWRTAMFLLCASKRLHSIFILRLFNDGPSMMMLFGAMLLFAKARYCHGCVLFSLAVSIKMNVLLFAPGLLLVLLQAHDTIWGTIYCLSICAAIQLVLGAPFLATFPISYLRKAFELDRVFDYQWTVNLKFLSPEHFVSKPLSLILLVMHLTTLTLLCYKWTRHAQRVHGRRIFLTGNSKAPRCLSPEYILYTLWVSNFVGIVFARTLHYQFYVWYFHSIPFLILVPGKSVTVSSGLGVVVSMASLEYAFHVYPATPTSSAVLQLIHVVVMASIVKGRVPSVLDEGTLKDKHKEQ